MRKKINDNKLDVIVDSAGTSGIHSGEAPDFRMCQTSKKFGTSIDDLRSRKFIIEDFDNFDVIYVMDKSNRSNILQLARNDEDKKKVQLILNQTYPGQNIDVPDPYYGGEEGFIEVYHFLDRATDCILEKIKNNELI
jgi:protein-tyrosine phosphatase